MENASSCTTNTWEIFDHTLLLHKFTSRGYSLVSNKRVYLLNCCNIELIALTRTNSSTFQWLSKYTRLLGTWEYDFSSWRLLQSCLIWNGSYGLLICTLISENKGLEKLRSVSNLRKISSPSHLNFFSVHLNFFSVCHLDFFSGLWYKSEKKSRWQTEKKNPGLQDLKFF